MLRDVFYYGNKPNVHPREKFAINFEDARKQATTEHFWIINEYCDYRGFNWDFDYELLPDEDVWAEEHINIWPSYHQKDSGTWLVPNNNSLVKVYRSDVEPLKRINNDCWVINDLIDTTKFDFSWHPDPTDPPYIYKWGCKWYSPQEKSCVEYHTQNATEIKYMDHCVELLPDTDRWIIPSNCDLNSFDFTWRPDPKEDDFIFEFGTQWQKTGGPQYITPNATQRKYVNIKCELLPIAMPNYQILNNYKIKEFDYSWHPDNTEQPYIYVFGNNQYPAEIMPTIQYVVEGATEIKYVQDVIATLDTDLNNWVIPDNVDITDFDFSWKPHPKDPPFIYEFGTQWQKTGGPRYVVENATETKYVSTQKVKMLSNETDSRWHVPELVNVESFDWSWHPDSIDKPYIYQFGTQWAMTGGPKFVMENATEIKYVEEPVATVSSSKENWIIPDNIVASIFDFSWHPYVEDQPYIYEFGTQHQKTGGPRYITPGCDENSPIKYIDRRILSSIRLPDKTNFETVEGIKIKEFDYSWHPDNTEQPYIYVFGNNLYPAEIMPTIKYIVEGATEIKYVSDIVATLDINYDNWIIPDNCDVSEFDFSWIPNPKDPPYIYQFPTQWHEYGGPQYVVPGATDYKFMDIKGAKTYTNKLNFDIPKNIDDSEFDYSWVPHPKDPPLIYEWGTQWQKTGGPRYVVKDATEVKYMTNQRVKMLSNENDKNWVIPDNVTLDSFDFSWHPDSTDKPFIYQFGTQWALTGGPKYVMPKAREVKYIEEPLATAAPTRDNWVIPEYVDTEGFDFSWHPYVEDQPYIYQFGTQWQKTGGPRYLTEGCNDSSPVKYIDRRILSAKKLPNKDNFEIVNNIKIKDFDYSWHPDETDGNYIYVFGNNLYPAEVMPTVRYIMNGATEIKYVHDIIATLDINYNNWIIPDNIDVSNFDFTWMPNPLDPPYIYEFGTQWQKTGGPRYVVENATETKYVDTQKVIKLPEPNKFTIAENVKIKDFDYSWHPDSTDEPYIYVFGNNQYPAEVMTTIQYIVDNANTIKYVNDIVATLDNNYENWVTPDDIDMDSFDYSWVPNPNDPPYIYEFATQHQRNGGPCYVVENATERKYVDIKAKRLPNKNNFIIEKNVKVKDFDYSWHPDNTDKPYIYVFGNTQYGPEIMPTITYKVKNAKKKKYVTDIAATLDVDMTNWITPINLDTEGFDYSWVPNPKEPPYIYEFGTQWQKTGGPRYVVKGATETKYISSQTVKHNPSKRYFVTEKSVKVKGFDYSWHPDSTEQPYIYVFGNNFYPPEIMPTIKYVMENATEIKYVHNPMAILDKSTENWLVPDNLDVSNFDFSWVPNPHEPPYIYEFNTQWQEQGGPQYIVPGATEKKYMNATGVKTLPNKTNFKVLIDADFDYSWHPSPLDPPYIYVFGNQWHDSVKDPTIEYVTPGATVKKYMTTPVAKVKAHMSNWVIPDNVNTANFDFSWRPDPDSPAYIYQFGTLVDDTDGPKYVTPNNNGEVVKLLRVETENVEEVIVVYQYVIETTLDDLVKQHPNELFWAKRKNIDYSNFDFEWRPSIEQARYVHVFGSPDSTNTQTYFVNSKMYLEGHTELNFVENNTQLTSEYLAELFVPSDMFLVDRGNPETAERYNALKLRFPNIQKTRFLNTWADTISRCINRSNTDLCWILNSELDYTNFDFKFYPNQWQMNMIHVFGTQWSHWGTTYMVNRNTFAEDTKYVKVIEHLKNLNFVKEKRAIATSCVYDIVVIDHGNDECQSVVDSLSNKTKNISTYKYDTSYFNTIKKLVDSLPTKKEHYIWICSSTNDYSKFDFSYICDPFAKDNLHVFASDKQKFGDTFLLDVNKTREIINDIDALQSYHKVNYIQHLNSPRLPAPVFKTFDEDHVETLKNKFNFPYAIFETESFDHKDVEPISLWTEETKNILVTSTGASRIIVPKELYDYPYINELYDFPYIKTSKQLLKSSPLDIVFLSNGEINADENYEHLLYVTRGLKNRIVRVDGINGRVSAYHATALASNTSWAFTVFAKIKVDNKFDWGWQPDRLQRPKHYIFTALNPLNGLEYGHQAVIAYNKKLVLNNFGEGLDFTLDDPHESVDMLSGVAHFNTDPYSTWRTAFREVLKLKSDYSDISAERLRIWLDIANGQYGEDCLRGAHDAVKYYESVGGDMDKLKLSYEWEWLKKYYNSDK